VPPCSATASPALITRFISTWRIWVASTSTRAPALARSSSMRAWAPTLTWSTSLISVTTASSSSTSISNRPRPEYASSCRHRSAAREDAVMMWSSAAVTPGWPPAWRRASCALPTTLASRLLKSWAMLPAISPRLSSFWAANIFCSSARCSVRSSITAIERTNAPPSLRSATPRRRTGISVPSLRRISYSTSHEPVRKNAGRTTSRA